MKENKYDDPVFFEKYSHMARSEQGLAGAGEWDTLKRMLPALKGRRVLDLGCGYGWHCIYAAEHGAQLHITERSMATELLIHAYLDGIFDRWMRAGEAHGHQDRRLYKTAKRLKNATAVIDMGERSVDANRWVFDLLAHGYGILCFLLGSRA